MERPIDPSFKKRQTMKRVGMSILGFAVVVGPLTAAHSWIRPSLSRNRLRTARVDVGPLEATISASGTVVPEFEQVLSSPIDSRVVKVLRRPGAALHGGEIVEPSTGPFGTEPEGNRGRGRQKEWYALVDDFRTLDLTLLADIPSGHELYGSQNRL
jgi:hypothetical protein